MSGVAALTQVCQCAGATSSSNEGKLIGIIVGVVIACIIMLLIIVGCYCVHRRHYKAEGKADGAAAAVGPREDSVYIRGLKVQPSKAGLDNAALDSPEHLDKMRKLQAMNFAKTNLSPSGKGVASSPGAAESSPGAIGAKGFAFASVTTPGRGEPFGSPIYTPRGTNLISQLFSTKSGHQVGSRFPPTHYHWMMLLLMLLMQ